MVVQVDNHRYTASPHVFDTFSIFCWFTSRSHNCLVFFSRFVFFVWYVFVCSTAQRGGPKTKNVHMFFWPEDGVVHAQTKTALGWLLAVDVTLEHKAYSIFEAVLIFIKSKTRLNELENTIHHSNYPNIYTHNISYRTTLHPHKKIT